MNIFLGVCCLFCMHAFSHLCEKSSLSYTYACTRACVLVADPSLSKILVNTFKSRSKFPSQLSMGPKVCILLKLMGFWNQRNGEICWHFTLAAPCHVFVFQLLSHMPIVYTYTEGVSKARFVVVSRFRCSRTRSYLNRFTVFSRTHGKGMSGCGETNYKPSRRLKRKVCAKMHESTKLETFTHPHYSN